MQAKVIKAGHLQSRTGLPEVSLRFSTPSHGRENLQQNRGLRLNPAKLYADASEAVSIRTPAPMVEDIAMRFR